MSLEQLANIAEVFGMLVVAITLIFLTLQMRQNTHAMKVASAQNFVDLYNTFTGHLSSNKELADLWYKGLSDYSSLTAGDRVRVSCANGQLMRIYESAYLQWCEGALDDQL